MTIFCGQSRSLAGCQSKLILQKGYYRATQIASIRHAPNPRSLPPAAAAGGALVRSFSHIAPEFTAEEGLAGGGSGIRTLGPPHDRRRFRDSPFRLCDTFRSAGETDSFCERDRRFESRFLQRGVLQIGRSIGSRTTFAPRAGSVSPNANRAKHPAVLRPYLGVGDGILPRTRASACMC